MRTTIDNKRVHQLVEVKTKTLIKHIPYCYYLIHLIVSKSDHKNNVDGWVKLQKKLLNKVIPSHTRLLITHLLVQLEIIQVDHTYVIGERSKGYRLSSTYALSDTHTIDLIQKGLHVLEDESCSNTQKDHIISNINSKKDVLVNLPYVESFLKKVHKVERNIQKTRNWKNVEKINQNIEYSFQLEQLTKINLDYDQMIVDGVLDEIKHLVQKVSDGITVDHMNVHNRVDRVFTPITNLKSEYRRYLRDTGNCSLVGIDFKTSHLFHLLKLIVDRGANNEVLLKEVEKVKNIGLTDIYVHVMKEWNKINRVHVNRKQAKKLFITRFLYGMYPKSKTSLWVKSLFPAISEFVSAYGRKELSIDLQRSESKLLNQMVFKRITQGADARITVYGLFDSVLVDRNHFDLVHQIMDEESAKYFGYAVPLTVDQMNEVLLFNNY